MSRILIVDFSHKIRNWDGFGFNYVHAAQTRDILNHPQEYGGFSLLSETDRETILDMVFGDDGLKPGVIKMFLDSFHQDEPGEGYNFDPNLLDMAAYEHMCTTLWMTYCIKEGVKRTRQRGVDPEIVVTLYGPPGWAIKQKMTRGRDLDPEMKYEVVKYIISWAKFLREEHNLNVRYLSLHNEGADYKRWPADGSDHPGMYNHDYNWFCPPGQIVDFIKFMTGQLKALGLDKELSITSGEITFWWRFYEAGYPGYNRLTKQLTILKASEDTSWLKEAHSQVLQQALKNLDRAFEHFFDRRAGNPQFKSKRARQSIRYPQPKPNWIAPDGRQIYLPKVGHVRVVIHHPAHQEFIEANKAH